MSLQFSSHLLLHVRLALLGLKGLAHTERNARLIQRLVRSNRHPNLIPDAQQKQASLGAVDGDLSDEFVEHLRVEFSSHGTNAGLPGLTLLKPAVEFLLQIDDIQAGSGGAGNVLNPQLPIFCPFPEEKLQYNFSSKCYQVTMS